jgi:glycosyltransferase involved in cell wall biosynthesis
MINFSAPINRGGYGIVAANLAKAFDALGAEVALFPIGPLDCDHQDVSTFQKMLDRSKFYHTHAPSLKLWHSWDLASHPTRGIRSASTFFELESLTNVETYQLSQMNRVFAFGGWAEKVMIRSGVTAPITKIHCGADRSVFSESPFPSGPTTFINAGKWEIRKGHDILPTAFRRAFNKDDDVRLLMLCSNPFLNEKESLEWEHNYIENLGDQVKIVPRQHTQADVAKVFASAHCGVFPSRGEGWNMEAMELLSMGRHVIATKCSAHTDFLDSNNSTLIDVRGLESAYDGKWFFGQGKWSSIDDQAIDNIAASMRLIHELRKSGQLGINMAGIQTTERLSWQSSAKEILDTLEVPYGV